MFDPRPEPSSPTLLTPKGRREISLPNVWRRLQPDSTFLIREVCQYPTLISGVQSTDFSRAFVTREKTQLKLVLYAPLDQDTTQLFLGRMFQVGCDQCF